MKRSLRFLLLLSGLIALLFGLTSWSVYREQRQERLNRDLIAAIKVHDDQAALQALEQGADSHAQERLTDRRSLWQRLLDLISGRHAPPSKSPSMLMSVMSIPQQSFIRYPPSAQDDYTPSYSLVRALLEQDANPNERDTSHMTPLMYAVVYNRPTLVRLMLAHGGNPDQTDDTESMGWADIYHHHGFPFSYMHTISPPNQGPTLLMCALKYSPECVKAILEGHAHVNIQGGMRETALLQAIEKCNAGAVKLLLEHHADCRLKNSEGDTPLGLARNWLDIYRRDKDSPGTQQAQQIVNLLKQAGRHSKAD